MGSFLGFPDKTHYTPVPNALFGALLEEMDDLPALKCLLRVMWLCSQKKGFPRYLAWEELFADRTLARALASAGPSYEGVLGTALETAQRAGGIIRLRVERGQGVVDVYMPNTEEGRRAATHMEEHGFGGQVASTGAELPSSAARPNIFSLYEENIGIITPLVAEELKEAEEVYPEEWIREAFREAVVRNRRSWRYIEAILKRWSTEGREHGEPGGHTKKVDSKEWIRRHGLTWPS